MNPDLCSIVDTDEDVNKAKLSKCDCCGVMVSYVRGSAWHGEEGICRPCFFTWYEEGLTNKDAIKAHRLRVYGDVDTQEFKGG